MAPALASVQRMMAEGQSSTGGPPSTMATTLMLSKWACASLEDGHFKALIRLGDLERRRGNYRAAGDLYEAAKHLDDDSWPVQLGLGIVYRETDRPADAITALQRAVALNPKDGETHHHLGLARLLAGDTARAAEAIQQAVSLGFSTR